MSDVATTTGPLPVRCRLATLLDHFAYIASDRAPRLLRFGSASRQHLHGILVHRKAFRQEVLL